MAMGMVHNIGMRLANEPAADVGSQDALPWFRLAPPPDYEEIPIPLVERMMRDVDRRARGVGIASGLVAVFVAIFLFMLSQEAVLIAVATAASGTLAGFVFSRLGDDEHS